jgi:hypothetical protein
VAELAETGRTLSPIREKHASGAKQAAEKLAVLKGHGFSRPVERPKQNAALAAEGMQVVENTFPQRPKPKLHLPIEQRG